MLSLKKKLKQPQNTKLPHEFFNCKILVVSLQKTKKSLNKGFFTIFIKTQESKRK